MTKLVLYVLLLLEKKPNLRTYAFITNLLHFQFDVFTLNISLRSTSCFFICSSYQMPNIIIAEQELALQPTLAPFLQAATKNYPIYLQLFRCRDENPQCYEITPRDENRQHNENTQ